jgi:hypothetical protein
MRLYSKLGNGAWREKRCNMFNVGSCGVKIPKAIATRINNILRRMPKEKTLGELADEGYRYWLAHYEDMGHASQKHLAEAINAVAKETVVVAKRRYTRRVVAPVPALPNWLAEMRETATPAETPAPSEPPHIVTDIAAKLSQKYKVTVTPPETSEVVPQGVFEVNVYEDLNTAQLRAKCVAQALQLLKINAENADLRKQLYGMKDRIAQIVNVNT